MRFPLALAALSLLAARPVLACPHCHEKEPAAQTTAQAQPEKQPEKTAQARLADDSIFLLDAKWTDQDGKKVTLGSFQGQPLVVAMIFTSCPGACPLTTSDMQEIEKGLTAAQREKVRFLLVSFDSKRDTPAQLQAFARGHKLGPRWSLLTGTPDAVRDLAAVLGVQYKQEPSGDFNHSNLISVVGADGVVRHQQIGLRQDPAESVAALRSMLQKLAGK